MRKLIALVIVLTAVMAVAAPASAADLTPEQKERFLTGSVEVGSFDTRAQAEAFLRDHPEGAFAIPIALSSTTMPVFGTRTGTTIEGTVLGAWTPNRCEVATGLLGTLFSFCVRRYWTWNGVRVVYAPNPDITPSITAYGAVEGWHYNGIVEGGNVNIWMNCSGSHAHSCHYQKRQGEFEGLYQLGITFVPWKTWKVGWKGQWWTGGGW